MKHRQGGAAQADRGGTVAVGARGARGPYRVETFQDHSCVMRGRICVHLARTKDEAETVAREWDAGGTR